MCGRSDDPSETSRQECRISDDLCDHLVADEHCNVSTTHPFNESRCAECGEAFDGSLEQERAEVVNQVSGRRGVVHASCYLDHDDVLEIA